MPGGCCLTPAEPARCRCVNCGPATGDDHRRSEGGAPAPPAPDDGPAVVLACGGTSGRSRPSTGAITRSSTATARSILRHDQDAQDALQSTMTKAFAALQEEQRDFEVRPWLFRIAHNEAISLLRRRRPTAELEAAASLGTDGLAEQVEDRRRLAELESDLADLPERQRAALVLRELNGLGHDEIAVVLDSTARSVKQTIFEARTALHECAEGRSMPCRGRPPGAVGRRRPRAARPAPAGAPARLGTCRSFQVGDRAARADLAALVPPLPVAGAAALLAHLLPAPVRGRRRRRRGRRHRARRDGVRSGRAWPRRSPSSPPRRSARQPARRARPSTSSSAAATGRSAALQPTTDAATRRAAARPAPTSTSAGAPRQPDRRPATGRRGPARRPGAGAQPAAPAPARQQPLRARPARSLAPAAGRCQARRPVRRTGAAPRPAATPAGAAPSGDDAGRAAAKAPRGVGRARPPPRRAPSPPAPRRPERARRSSSGDAGTPPPGSTHAGATAGPDATGAAARSGHPSSAGSGQP